MTEIPEELHYYVPEDGNKLLKVLQLLLNYIMYNCIQIHACRLHQLTAERARNVQLIRVNSEDSKSALAGLLPTSK